MKRRGSKPERTASWPTHWHNFPHLLLPSTATLPPLPQRVGKVTVRFAAACSRFPRDSALKSAFSRYVWHGGQVTSANFHSLPPVSVSGLFSRALPKKRCLELSGAQNSSNLFVGRVPDTFFWAKLFSSLLGAGHTIEKAGPPPRLKKRGKLANSIFSSP